MAIVRLHQLVHGYRHGHELLVGSTRLNPVDADLVTRLSDLSGTLSSDSGFSPYLTVYPIHSREFYALARTWPDESASRSGCVLTHTLLIPMEQWIRLPDPQVAAKLLRKPKIDELGTYKSEAELITEETLSAGFQDSGEPAMSSEFVARFFGEGLRPLVWLGEPKSDDTLWKILRSLWPRLRAQFSCCTLSLQPRMLGDRQFDLMFAPTSVYSRYHKFTPTQILDASDTTSNGCRSSMGPWCKRWTQIIFSSVDLQTSLGALWPLWSELSEDPTSVRRIYLIEELRERAKESPTAAVGAMDVVESLSPTRDDALELKQVVLHDAIKVARRVPASDDTIRCLRLIDDRLRRTAFAGVAAEAREELADAVANDFMESPELVLHAGETLLTGEGEKEESAFVDGIFAGLGKIANNDPERLLLMRQFPNVAPEILARSPMLAVAYLKGSRRERFNAEAQKDLLTWTSTRRGSNERRALRNVLLPALDRSEDVELASELLCDISESDVSAVLDALCSPTMQFQVMEMREVVEKHVANPHPIAVRNWVKSTSEWSEGIASLAAATYSRNQSGLEDLLADPILEQARKPHVIAIYLRDVSRSWFPDWLRTFATDNLELVEKLLTNGKATRQDITCEVGRLLDNARNMPLAQSEVIKAQIETLGTLSCFDRLVDVVMRSIISGITAGTISSAECDAWQSKSFSEPWLKKVAVWDLKSLLSHHRGYDSDAPSRAWQWLASAPGVLYTRTPSVLHELVDGVLSDSKRVWPSSATEHWVKVLRRSAEESEFQTRLKLCVQALKFGFDNKRFPLGPVVAETFFDVYSAITSGSSTPPETASFFGFFDWDKAKELRRALVEAFMDSQWPPSGLALAAREISLLRKIVKRVLRRSGGNRYMDRMISDLACSSIIQAKALHECLLELSKNPYFKEEWD